MRQQQNRTSNSRTVINRTTPPREAPIMAGVLSVLSLLSVCEGRERERKREREGEGERERGGGGERRRVRERERERERGGW